MKRREFIGTSFGLLGGLATGVARGQVKPCPPPTLTAQPGPDVNTVCTPSSGAQALRDDWDARTSGSGVVSFQGFESAAEVDQYRWSSGYMGGNDPAGRQFPGTCMYESSGGIIPGTGCLAMSPRTDGIGSEWWWPFSAKNGAGNGKGADDPAANSSTTVRTWDPSDGSSTTNTFPYGRYGNDAYRGDGNFEGNEYWIQCRVKYDSRRLASGNPGGGKMFYFTLCETSAPAQELITESRDQTYNYSLFSMYRSVSPPLEGDSPGLGNQPRGTVGTVGDRVCWFDDRNGARANCWRFPLDQWCTLLYHVVPGTDGGGNTTVEVLAAEHGETAYKRIWYQTEVDLPYTQGRPRCHSALIISNYINGQSIGTPFTHRFDQLIFSKAFIPCPQAY